MTDDVLIERLVPADSERARAIRLRALRDAPDAFWTTLAEEEQLSPERWRERLAAADAATFVARRGDDDVGLVVGAAHPTRKGDAGLFSMWVAPEARGGGIAAALLSAVVDWARGGGYRTLRLDVADTNEAAMRLYERMGFVVTGDGGSFPAPRDHITEHERALDLTT